MHIPWEAIELFLAAAEHRSLAKAAKVLGVTQPTVSRRLAELEAIVGESLFLRSVEGVALTAAGERMLSPARRMAENHGELERIAAGESAVPSGVVLVTAPPGIAYELLAPFALTMRTVLPAVRLSVEASVQPVDLVRREADLALRMNKPVTRDLVVLASLEEPVAAFSSPAYARRLGASARLSDIDWISWPAANAELPPSPQLAARIPDFQPVFAANDFLVQLRAAEHGVGAIILSTRTSHLAGSSSLVRLPLDFGPMKVGLHLVCARNALAAPRVRAVAEMLAKELTPSARIARGTAQH